MRLIDANALKKKLYKPFNWNNSPEEIQEQSDFNYFDVMIDAAPTIDAVPVVHGRWKEHYFSHRVDTYGNPDIGMECSVCGFRWYSAQDAKNFFRYCPNCGAKMDGKEGRGMADFGLNRNGSGYYDETAYKAFMDMAKAGDIWTANDGREEVLILRNQWTFCNCLTLTDKLRDKQCVEIERYDGGTAYTNPGMIKYLFNDRLGRYVHRLPESEFAKVKEAVEDAMGFGKQTIDRRAEAHALLDMILDKAGGL